MASVLYMMLAETGSVAGIQWVRVTDASGSSRQTLRREAAMPKPGGQDPENSGVFARYGLSPADVARLREQFRAWPRS